MKGYKSPYYKRPRFRLPTQMPGSGAGKYHNNDDEDTSDEIGSGSKSNIITQLLETTVAPSTVPSVYQTNNLSDRNHHPVSTEMNNEIGDEDDEETNETELPSGDGSTETMNSIRPLDGSGYGPIADEGSEAKVIRKTRSPKEEMYI